MAEFIDHMKITGAFLQSDLWAQFKSCFGWKDLKLQFRGTELHVLLRQFGGRFSLAYVPYAPESASDIEELSSFLKGQLPKNCIFIRYDLPWYVEQEGTLSGDACGILKKASLDIQPPSSVVLDINRPDEEILKGMKERARRNIKTAAKKGVTVSRHTVQDLHIWYDLYKETSARDRIAIHPFGYYEKLFLLAEKQDDIDVRLYLASVDGDDIAGIITLFYKDEGVYLYGASCNRKRETMPAYALQWQGIRDAKAAGCLRYDFFGMPPADDPNHPMHGLYLFKTGFGGDIIHRPGCWDYPCRPVLYRLYRVAESARKYYYKKLKK
ncbi:MAG: peptidoglycan bridge formation glycyltransferase FemA/FemB family protein, partial [Spirochaetia bacterium]|nr:peptidoglycan bridge formation glycyltransferase FemA/FemB family protein [Spirochaetia bacterium]